MASETCKICGKPKEFFHLQECKKNQTLDIIQKVNTLLKEHPQIRDRICELSTDFLQYNNLTWDELITFQHLAKIGCDDIGNYWCRSSLDLFNQTSSESEKVAILDNIISVLYCYDLNSKQAPSKEMCSYCGKSMTDCKQWRQEYERNLKEDLFSRIEFPDEVQKKFRETNFEMNHLSFNMFLILIGSFDANHQDTRSITARQIYSLIIQYIEYFEVVTMIAKADKLVFG